MAVDVECLLFKEPTTSERTVIAVEFSELCSIDKDKFWDLRKYHPALGSYFSRWVSSCEEAVPSAPVGAPTSVPSAAVGSFEDEDEPAASRTLAAGLRPSRLVLSTSMDNSMDSAQAAAGAITSVS